MKSLKEVDWSKAPEGATHYNEDCFCPWLKETPASYFKGDDWIEYSTAPNNNSIEHLRDAVKRPQEWDGSGLPPVGTGFEYFCVGGGEWIKCEIVGHYFENVVAVGVLDSNAVCLPAGLFRPIKTPEQIAAEERLHAIDEMIDFVVPCITYRNLIGALYDAGYRKTEVKK